MLETLLGRAPRLAVYVAALGAPLAYGGYRGWPLALTEIVPFLGVGLWIVAALVAGRLEWRRTALDLPLALLVALVVVQIVLGNRPLVSWALAPVPAAVDAPARLSLPYFAVGTVTPSQTTQSLLLLLTYVAVYVLVTQTVSHRSQLSRLVQTLLLFGGLLAFLGLGDYLTGGGWLVEQRVERADDRLSATFVNANHFGTWLVMIICLGIGYLAARRRRGGHGPSLFDVLTRWRVREDLIRRYLPFASLGVMVVALVFTLSRGAILALLVTVAATLLLLGRLGLARWALALLGALIVVVTGYGTLIGLSPWIARLGEDHIAGARWIQAVTSLPMLADFPVLGVGLGAYRDIYFRYQPAVLEPGRVYYPYAHNDLMQLGLELGVVGLVVVGFAAWSVGRDLLGAHLLGRGRCPVGGGEAGWAQRSDPFSVGIGIGALAAIVALLVHALFDFSARIPANGVLAAACLGIATVALHTRFGAEHSVLIRVIVMPLARPGPRIVAGLVALTVLLLPAALAVRSALATAQVDALERSRSIDATSSTGSSWLEDRSVLSIHSRIALHAATRAWYVGLDPAGKPFASREERARVGQAFVGVVLADARRALALAPTNPFFHERLARAHALAAAMDPGKAETNLALATTHIRRALSLAPNVAAFHETVVDLALSRLDRIVPAALDAAREAVSREPAALERLVAKLLPRNLADAEWLAIVPATAVDRLHLATLLERQGAVRDALPMYRRAVEAASAEETPVARWMLATLLLRQKDPAGAEIELGAALGQEPDNPQLHLTLAESLAHRGDPAALDSYRTALVRAEGRDRRGIGDTVPFAIRSPRLVDLIASRLEKGYWFRAIRYRRAFAQYLTDRRLWDAALDHWRTIIAEHADDAAAQFSFGVALEGTGDRNAAIEAYRVAVSRDGREPRYRLRLARALWETEQYYQAMLAWQEVERREPQNVEARLALARALAKAGDRRAAAARYRGVLDLVPEHREAQAELQRLGVAP